MRSIVGKAQKIEAYDQNVVVEIQYGETIERDEYDYVILARGFDALWFTKLFDRHTHEQLASMSESLDRTVIERSIGEDLAIKNFSPRLHLPMLAGVAQGPGFPNLSCLGLLSDCVLTSYQVHTETH